MFTIDGKKIKRTIMTKYLFLISLFVFQTKSMMCTQKTELLYGAISNNNIGLAGELIEAGANPDGTFQSVLDIGAPKCTLNRSHNQIRTVKGTITPLMVAAALGYYEIAELLLKADAKTTPTSCKYKGQYCSLPGSIAWCTLECLTAEEIAKKEGNNSIASLIQKYEK